MDDYKLDSSEQSKKQIDSWHKKDVQQLALEISKFHESSFSTVLDNIKKHNKEFVIYPMHATPHIKIDFITQMLLYSEKIIIIDPIYDTLMNSAYVKPNISAIKDGIIHSVDKIVHLKKAIEEEIIYLIPSLVFKKGTYMEYRKAVDKDILNEDFQKIVFKNIKFKLYRDSNALLLSYGENDFKFFSYGRITKHKTESENSLTFESVIPASLDQDTMNKYEITEEDLVGWVNSELNNEIIRTAEKINKELFISNIFGLNIVTDVNLYSDLLRYKSSNKTSDFYNVLNVSIPTFSNISLNKLLDIREKEDDLFKLFRINLKTYINEIEKENKNGNINEISKKLKEEYIDPEINKLKREMKTIRRKTLIRGFPRAVILGATLGATVAMGIPWLSLLSTGVAMNLIKEISDEYADYITSIGKLKQNSIDLSRYYLFEF